jgi:hypothetical protein
MRSAPSAPRRRGGFSRIPLCALATLGVSAALLTGGWTLRATAQDPGGLRLNFGINQSFEAETNQRLQLDSPGTAVTSMTRLDFGLRSETRTQSLRLSASLPLRLFYAPDDTRRFVVETPDLDFAYSRFAPRADFTASGSLRTEDLRFVRAIDEIVDILDPVVPVVPGDPVIPVDPVDPIPVPDPDLPPGITDPADPVSPLPPGDLPDDEELDDIDLIDGRGTRQRIRLDSRLRLGLGGPVTTTLRAGLRETRYSGDVNPGLRDSRRLTFGVTTALRLTPVTEATVDLLLERFERDDEAGFRRDTRRLGFGLRHEVTQTLTARANLGFGWVESRDDEDLLRRRRGLDAGLGFDLALPRGTLRFDSQTSVTDTGRRSTASLSHSLPMPNGTLSLSASARRLDDGTRLSFTVGRNMDLRRGPLSASVGLTRSPGGSWGTIGRVNYREALPRGSWRVSLLQGFTLDEEDRETRRTIASAGYTHDINRSSRVTLDAAFSRSPTTDAARFRATYSRDVTPDWSLNLGYRYDNRSRTGGRADSHSVFLTFGRSFDIGL